MITYFNTTGLVSCRNSLETHIFKFLTATEEMFMKGWNPLSKGTQLFTHNFINVLDSNYNVESLIFKHSRFFLWMSVGSTILAYSQCLPSLDMPTAKHFFSRQYWQLFLVNGVMSHFSSFEHLCVIPCVMHLRKKPLKTQINIWIKLYRYCKWWLWFIDDCDNDFIWLWTNIVSSNPT